MGQVANELHDRYSGRAGAIPWIALKQEARSLITLITKDNIRKIDKAREASWGRTAQGLEQAIRALSEVGG